MAFLTTRNENWSTLHSPITKNCCYVLDDSDLAHPFIRDRQEVWKGGVRTVRVSGDHVFIFGVMGVQFARLTDHSQMPQFIPIRLSGVGYGEQQGQAERSSKRKLIVDVDIVD
jgi:hypothetical protein